MWHGFTTGGLRSANRAPYKRAHATCDRQTNLSGLSGHLPYKGRHNDERTTMNDGAEGPIIQ